MPRRKHTEIAIANYLPLSQVPETHHRALAIAVKRELHCNRDQREITLDANNPKDAKLLAHMHKMLTMLWSLGYDQKWVTVEKGETFWRKARIKPLHGTHSISGISHRFKVTAKVRIMQIVAPLDDNGNERYDRPSCYCDVIYISGSKWTFGCTRGNPYADSDKSFDNDLRTKGYQHAFVSWHKDKPRKTTR